MAGREDDHRKRDQKRPLPMHRLNSLLQVAQRFPEEKYAAEHQKHFQVQQRPGDGRSLQNLNF
jgi:hypothetical protein